MPVTIFIIVNIAIGPVALIILVLCESFLVKSVIRAYAVKSMTTPEYFWWPY